MIKDSKLICGHVVSVRCVVFFWIKVLIVGISFVGSKNVIVSDEVRVNIESVYD